MGTEAPALGTLPDLALCVSSSGYTCVFFYILDELVNIGISSFLSLPSKLVELKERVIGILQISSPIACWPAV